MFKTNEVNTIISSIIEKAREGNYNDLKSIMATHYSMTIRSNIPFLFESAESIFKMIEKRVVKKEVKEIIKKLSDGYDVEIPWTREIRQVDRRALMENLIFEFIGAAKEAERSEDFRRPLMKFMIGYFRDEARMNSTIFRDLFNMIVLLYWDYSGHVTEPFIKIKFNQVKRGSEQDVAGCMDYRTNIDYATKVLNWDTRQPEKIADVVIKNREDYYRKAIIRKYTGIDKELFLCDAFSEWEQETHNGNALKDRLEKAIGFDERKTIVMTRVANLVLYLWSQIDLGTINYTWTDSNGHFTDALWAAFNLNKYMDNNYKFIGSPDKETKEKIKSFFYRIVKNLPAKKISSPNDVLLTLYMNQADEIGCRFLFDIVVAKCSWECTIPAKVMREVIDIN